MYSSNTQKLLRQVSRLWKKEELKKYAIQEVEKHILAIYQ
jgi:hypothetical protein